MQKRYISGRRPRYPSVLEGGGDLFENRISPPPRIRLLEPRRKIAERPGVASRLVASPDFVSTKEQNLVYTILVCIFMHKLLQLGRLRNFKERVDVTTLAIVPNKSRVLIKHIKSTAQEW